MKPKLRFLYFAYSISFVILLLLSFLFYDGFKNLSNSISKLDHTNTVIQQVNIFESYFINSESSQRGFLLTNDTIFLQAYFHLRDSANATLQNIKKLTADNRAQQQNLLQLNKLMAKRLNYLNSNINTIKRDSSFKQRILNGKKIMDSCHLLIAQIKNEEFMLMEERLKRKQFYEASTPDDFKMLFFFSFLLLIVSFVLIAREIMRRASYQAQLEKKMQDLSRMHTELQQFSFIASHNLQEPLRKIRTFSNRLVLTHTHELNKEGKLIVHRIDSSAARMHKLMDSFSNFLTIYTPEEKKLPVSLNSVINEAIEELKEKISKKTATIYVEELKTINGYIKQLFILFKNLLDNSLTFSREGISPVITIKGEIMNWQDVANNKDFLKTDYYKITVADNGSGFDNFFSQKIFKLFETLDGMSDEVRGIGLAIVQHVMMNHHGFATAEGKPGEGACFYLYFPAAGE